MNACSEFVLDSVVEITAIPLSAYNASATMLSPVIIASAFNPTFNSDTVVVGLTKAVSSGNPVGSLIPIVHDTAKVKDSESDNVAGRLHSVSIECQVDDRESDRWQTLLLLERTPRHLILKLRDGSRVFVMATEDTYLCTMQRGDGKTSLSWRIQNLMGLQLVK